MLKSGRRIFDWLVLARVYYACHIIYGNPPLSLKIEAFNSIARGRNLHFLYTVTLAGGLGMVGMLSSRHMLMGS